MSPHSLLKEATRGAHDRVDATFAALDLGREADYRTFLERHAAAFLPAEEALTSAGAAELVDGWNELCRTPALLADLADLAIAVPAPRRAPDYAGTAAIFGGAYVLEGSRLGGAMLRRSVGSGLPRRFLDSIQPPGRWRAFVAQLNRALHDPPRLEHATLAALDTFALFE